MIHNDPVDPMPTYEASTLVQSLPAAAIDTIVGLAGPDAQCPHIGGAIAREQGGASAVSHRDAAYSLLTIGIAAPPVVDVTRGHTAAALDALAPCRSTAPWYAARCPRCGTPFRRRAGARARTPDSIRGPG